LDGCRWFSRWWLRFDVIEDLLNYVWVNDVSDDTHGAATQRAHGNINIKDSFESLSPGQSDIYLRNGNWVEGYIRDINAFIEKHDGKVLSRSLKMEKVEGDRDLPTNVILVEFPNRQAALNFFEDPIYQPLRQSRLNGSVSEFTLFPAEDLALFGAQTAGT
jgi:uncharacterized protein (DUF1330 family)